MIYKINVCISTKILQNQISFFKEMALIDKTKRYRHDISYTKSKNLIYKGKMYAMQAGQSEVEECNLPHECILV